MTRDEIKLVIFILLALLVGASVKHFREPGPASSNAPPTPAPTGWAKPPYVFKNANEMRRAAP